MARIDVWEQKDGKVCVDCRSQNGLTIEGQTLYIYSGKTQIDEYIKTKIKPELDEYIDKAETCVNEAEQAVLAAQMQAENASVSLSEAQKSAAAASSSATAANISLQNAAASAEQAEISKQNAAEAANNASASSSAAQIWAEGGDENVTVLGGEHSAKIWCETAAARADAAETSAVAAAASAQSATQKASEAAVSAQNAESSASAAEASKNGASGFAEAAASAATNAESSSQTAANYASEASSSAQSAASEAASAETAQQSAAASATSAAASEQNVAASATAAASSAQNAGNYADNAEESANTAQIWAEGGDENVTVLGGEHSAKRWAEIASQSADIPAATEEASGLVRLCTETEVRAGTENTAAVTPQKLAKVLENVVHTTGNETIKWCKKTLLSAQGWNDVPLLVFQHPDYAYNETPSNNIYQSIWFLDKNNAQVAKVGTIKQTDGTIVSELVAARAGTPSCRVAPFISSNGATNTEIGAWYNVNRVIYANSIVTYPSWSGYMSLSIGVAYTLPYNGFIRFYGKRSGNGAGTLQFFLNGGAFDPITCEDYSSTACYFFPVCAGDTVQLNASGLATITCHYNYLRS